MAVYERTYKRYDGTLTPQWSRFLVLPRYSFKEAFRSRFFLAFFVLCLLPTLFWGLRVYLYHSAGKIFEAVPEIAEFFSQYLSIDAKFFRLVMYIQCILAFAVALWKGPGLVSRDLANNGLPLYLSRPISRAEYVLGKFSVLALLLSLITWVPGLSLFTLQSGYAGWGWAFENTRTGMSIFAGSFAWILLVSFLALALSAWVKWRPVAGFMMLVVVLGGAAFGGIFNLLSGTTWGNAINLIVVITRIWEGLPGLEPWFELPPWTAWGSLLTFVAFCTFLLNRKIRAYEVVS